MKRSRKNGIMMVVAAVAVIVGVVIAITSAGGHSRNGAHGSRDVARGGSLAVLAAHYLGITRAELRRELQTGRTLAEIADTRSGRSAGGLIDALVAARSAAIGTAGAHEQLSAARLEALRRRVTARVDRAAAGVANSRDRVVARYLGVSAARVSREQRAGRSLAEIAAATSGKSVAGLRAELISARRAAIAAAVRSGTLSREQAAARLATLATRVSDEVNQKPRTPGP
jgi:hypothetical protein